MYVFREYLTLWGALTLRPLLLYWKFHVYILSVVSLIFQEEAELKAEELAERIKELEAKESLDASSKQQEIELALSSVREGLVLSACLFLCLTSFLIILCSRSLRCLFLCKALKRLHHRLMYD